MATFTNMWQEVRLAIGDRRDIDTEIKAAFNDATLDLALMFRIRELIRQQTITTSEGVPTYPLGSEVYDVISVRNNTDGVLLEPGDYAQYASTKYDDEDENGTPSLWFIDGTDLYLFNNVPDDTGFSMTYRYILRPPELLASTAVFPLPREWERPAKLLAKSYVFELLGQNEKAIAAYQQAMAIAQGRRQYSGLREIYKRDNRINMDQNTVNDEGY